MLTVGKTALQGLNDRRGGDVVIAAEEVAFLPCFLGVWALGWHGLGGLAVALGLADAVVALEAWRRVSVGTGWRRAGFAPTPSGWWGRPRPQLAAEVVAYGTRAQVGGVVTLLNLRLDFALLGAMAGPAVLGTYAVASKYAELLRLPGTALTWVCYPKMAGEGPERAAQRASSLLLPALGLVAGATLPFLLLAGPVTRLLYGEQFTASVVPAQVLVVGMVLSGAAGVASGYLYGRGRPGLNSLGLGVGLVVTLLLDLALIPRFGALGAAAASTAAYLVGDACLLILFRVAAATTARREHAPRGGLETAP